MTSLWTRWRLKSPASRLFTQPFIRDQSKHESSASLAFVWGIHQWPVNSPHKWPETRKMFPFDDVIMGKRSLTWFLSEFLLLMMNSIHFYIRQLSKWSTRSREISRHLEGCTSRIWIRAVLWILYPPRQCYGILWIIRKQFGSDGYSVSCVQNRKWGILCI